MIFQDLLDKAVEEGRLIKNTQTAVSWLNSNVRTLNVQPNQVLAQYKSETSQFIYPGTLTLFKYRATNQRPYYDSFPLVIYLQETNNGFIGMNLHYISYAQRAILMDGLYQIARNKNTSQPIIAANYQFLSRFQRFRYFKPCVKRYLYSNVKSRFLSISPQYWNIALFLPLERFVGSSKEHVWSESALKVNRGNNGK